MLVKAVVISESNPRTSLDLQIKSIGRFNPFFGLITARNVIHNGEIFCTGRFHSKVTIS